MRSFNDFIKCQGEVADSLIEAAIVYLAIENIVTNVSSCDVNYDKSPFLFSLYIYFYDL